MDRADTGPVPLLMDGVTKRFRTRDARLFHFPGSLPETVTALDEVSLILRSGEIYGLVGPNGSGKTTLIKTCATLYLPDSGRGWVCGHPLEDGRAVRSFIGLQTDHERAFFMRLTAAENLRYFGRLRDLPDAHIRDRIADLTGPLGLGSLLDRRYDRCSTGMRKRIALARALLTRPRVLLLDEPTSSLDPMQADTLAGMLRDLARSEGIAVLVSSHQLDRLGAYADRVGLMHAGRLIGLPEGQEGAGREMVARLWTRTETAAGLAARWKGHALSSKGGEDPGEGLHDVRIPIPADGLPFDWRALLEDLLVMGGTIRSLDIERVDLQHLYRTALRAVEDRGHPAPLPGRASAGEATRHGPLVTGTLDRSGPRRPLWRKAVDLLWVQARTWMSYRFNFGSTLAGILLMLGAFAFIARLVDGGGAPSLARYGGDYFTFVLVGIAFAGVQRVALNGFAGMIREHQTRGTLEYLLLTPTPFDRILMMTTVLLLSGVLLTMVGYGAVGVLAFGADLHRMDPLATVAAFSMGALSIFGVGLISAGAVLIWKRADAVVFSLHGLLLFFGGVFFPVDVLPPKIQVVSRLLPITWALDALRAALIEGTPIGGIAPDLAVLGLFALFFIPLGLLFYRWAEHRARIEGTLLQF